MGDRTRLDLVGVGLGIGVRGNRSRYLSDYADSGSTVPVNGKHVVDAPHKLMQTELAFDDKRWFGRLGAKYTGQRYYTFVNDGRVSSYTVWDLGGGLRLGAVTLQVHVNNHHRVQPVHRVRPARHLRNDADWRPARGLRYHRRQVEVNTVLHCTCCHDSE